MFAINATVNADGKWVTGGQKYNLNECPAQPKFSLWAWSWVRDGGEWLDYLVEGLLIRSHGLKPLADTLRSVT